MIWRPNEKPKKLSEFFNSKEEFENLLNSISTRKIKEEKFKKQFQKFKRWYKEYKWENMEVYTGQIEFLNDLKKEQEECQKK